jgi:hypothetical protein
MVSAGPFSTGDARLALLCAELVGGPTRAAIVNR